MAVMLAARAANPSATAGSAAVQQLKALVLLENDPPGWAQQSEMRNFFGECWYSLFLALCFFMFCTASLDAGVAALTRMHCCAMRLTAATPLPFPALIVGGSEDSPKADAVGDLFAAELVSHVRHCDGHRPLPKNENDCARVVEQVAAFLLRHCHAAAETCS